MEISDKELRMGNQSRKRITAKKEIEKPETHNYSKECSRATSTYA
jgi:hypothetical protein